MPTSSSGIHVEEERKVPVEVQCHHCGKELRVSRDIFDDNEKIDLTCPACGKSFQIVSPKVSPLRLETTRKRAVAVSDLLSPEGKPLRLPEDQQISLKVLEGEDKGAVFPVDKPRITIGRTNGNINISEKSASRVHCALEVSDEGVLLRDLESTNGTLVDDKPIRTAPLASGSTFRIGNHIFQLLIASRQK